ncbi:YozE family protein [Pontibacillus yanchengensis]|uniref:YozE family protein n=2 Tax=Pontibacillus yanchengensis TaxID=462910 RepID=A0ACC7VB49_9BACI|nr:YozE family protein [Pontibacillus yanchengensis]MYL32823.1 YozE family protein [Pontibacillus yanchengensis]MYL51735.1 YozE family protein [Pontibacillus yanchengensis]
MRSFYHFMMTYRGKMNPDEESRLADWMFKDHSFPKQSHSYDEISRYLEWNIPFSSALKVFDDLWERYQMQEING